MSKTIAASDAAKAVPSTSTTASQPSRVHLGDSLKPWAADAKVRLGDSLSPWAPAPKVRLGDSLMPW